MKNWFKQFKNESGSALLSSVLFSSILLMTAGSLLSLSNFGLRSEHGRLQWTQAYYHAENSLNWAAQIIADDTVGGTNASFLGTFSYSGGNLSMAYLSDANAANQFNQAWVTIQNDPSGVADVYRVTASAQVGSKVRTLQASVQKNPPSQVFDYEYFLNNWGWWWGSTITGDGDNRANWDFDFRYSPTVNGSVLANGQIESNMTPVDPFAGTPPFNGLAATDLFKYVHSGAPRVKMPNLKDFSHYKTKATNEGGQLSIGTNVIINAVHNNVAKPGIYLVGSAADPIRIQGPVVVDGDVVISGTITGTGTLYVGGNLYIAGNMTYANGPSFATPPETMSSAARDTWVSNALSQNKDLVAFAVRESILAGAVNTQHWKDWEYEASPWGLKHIGNEGSLGRDGIRGTPDDGINYLDTNNDGTPDSAWYDADEDGIVDQKYNYATDIQMENNRAMKIDRYPLDAGNNHVNYDTLSSNSMNRLDGIFYCNHAVAARLGAANTIWNGSVISQDEAIVFSSTLKLNYDPRIHSRYSRDPNRYIDLGLPIAYLAKLQSIEEIAPLAGFAN